MSTALDVSEGIFAVLYVSIMGLTRFYKTTVFTFISPKPQFWGVIRRFPAKLVKSKNMHTPCLKKRPTLACYNFDTHERILILFGRNVTGSVGNQTHFTMPPQIACAFALPSKTGNTKSAFFTHMLYYLRALQQLDCVVYTMHYCAVLLKETRRPASADRTARASNFRRDLEAT